MPLKPTYRDRRMPVILVTKEAEIRKFTVQEQPGWEENEQNHHLNNTGIPLSSQAYRRHYVGSS